MSRWPITGADIKQAEYLEIQRAINSIGMPDDLWDEASRTAVDADEIAQVVFYSALTRAVRVVEEFRVRAARS